MAGTVAAQELVLNQHRHSVDNFSTILQQFLSTEPLRDSEIERSATVLLSVANLAIHGANYLGSQVGLDIGVGSEGLELTEAGRPTTPSTPFDGAQFIDAFRPETDEELTSLEQVTALYGATIANILIELGDIQLTEHISTQVQKLAQSLLGLANAAINECVEYAELLGLELDQEGGVLRLVEEAPHMSNPKYQDVPPELPAQLDFYTVPLSDDQIIFKSSSETPVKVQFSGDKIKVGTKPAMKIGKHELFILKALLMTEAGILSRANLREVGFARSLEKDTSRQTTLSGAIKKLTQKLRMNPELFIYNDGVVRLTEHFEAHLVNGAIAEIHQQRGPDAGRSAEDQSPFERARALGLTPKRPTKRDAKELEGELTKIIEVRAPDHPTYRAVRDFVLGTEEEIPTIEPRDIKWAKRALRDLVNTLESSSPEMMRFKLCNELFAEFEANKFRVGEQADWQETTMPVTESRGRREITNPEEAWKNYANCYGVDPDYFFPERGESTREAKEVCRGCVVREECLEYALTRKEKFGVWGGLSERERRRIRRQRRLQQQGAEA